MPKPDKQIIIDFIISCLEKGEQRGNILVKVGKKWGTSKSAFDRWLKIAKEQHTVKQQAIKDKLAKVDEQAAIEARKKAIMTADERKEALSKSCVDLIEKVNGNKRFTFFQGGKVVNSHNGEIFMLPIDTQAKILETIKGLVAELNKMEGDYAPTKVAQTNGAGEDVPYTVTLNLNG